MAETTTVEAFIAEWRDTGGSELANTQSFINGLCAILDVPPPKGSRSDDSVNDYVFEQRVFQNNGDGTDSFGRVDCYKRGHFVLEAKQGSDADRAAAAKECMFQRKRIAMQFGLSRSTVSSCYWENLRQGNPLLRPSWQRPCPKWIITRGSNVRARLI